MNTKQFKDCKEVDVLINDPNGFGLLYTYLSGNDKEYEYRCQMYQNRIGNPEASDTEILDQLGEGKGYVAEAATHKNALEQGLDFWFLKLPDNIDEYPVRNFESYADAIKFLKKKDDRYLIFSVELSK